MTKRIPFLQPGPGSHSISRVDPDRDPLPGQSIPAAPLEKSETTSEPTEEERQSAEQKRLDAAHEKTVAKTVAKRRKKDLSQRFGIPPTHGGGQVDAMVDPIKGATSGMSIYDAGVEKVREEHGDEAAEAARKDMARADFMRARKEHGEVESSSDDYYERVKTDDGQDWLVDLDTGEVIRVTGMSHEAIGDAYYNPRITLENTEGMVPEWAEDHAPFQAFASRAKQRGIVGDYIEYED